MEFIGSIEDGERAASLSHRFTEWDYLVFVSMLAVSACIGIYYACSGSRQSTTAEFLMGNRSMSVLPVSLSILASFMSAITLLGTAAEMYVYGTQYMIIMFAYCLVIPAAAYLYLPVFYDLQLTSTYEYLELRFHHVVRSIGSIVFSIQMLLYMAIVLYAPSLALSQVTGISVWTSVLSIGIICTFYTSVGGIKAVVWTDVFQILLMFGSMLTIVIKGARDLGGFHYVIEKAREGERLEFSDFSLDPTVRHTVWGLTIGCYFTWQYVYGVSQAMVQRYLTLPTLGKARFAIWLNLPGLSFLMLICSISGLVIYAKYSACDPKLTKHITSDDQLLPLYVMEILGNYPGIPGLFVSGVFSGALSTVSSGVNSLAAVALEDFVRRYIKSNIRDEDATNLSKGMAMMFGLISILLVYVAQQLGGVLQAALSIFGMIGGPLLGVFTLGLFFPCANSIGAVVGFVGSLAVSFWIGIGAFVTKPMVPRAPVSVLGCINQYLNATNATTFTLPKSPDLSRNDDIFVLYRLSYVWFSMLGCNLVIVLGLLVSLITGCTSPLDVDPRTIHPLYNHICRKLLPDRLQRKFLVRPAEEYLQDKLKVLARSPPFFGADNFTYFPGVSEEKQDSIKVYETTTKALSTEEATEKNQAEDVKKSSQADGLVEKLPEPTQAAISSELSHVQPALNQEGAVAEGSIRADVVVAETKGHTESKASSEVPHVLPAESHKDAAAKDSPHADVLAGKTQEHIESKPSSEVSRVLPAEHHEHSQSPAVHELHSAKEDSSAPHTTD